MIVDSAPAQTIPMHPGYLRAKRALDVLFSLLILLPLCLVIAIVAVAIRLDSRSGLFPPEACRAEWGRIRHVQVPFHALP